MLMAGCCDKSSKGPNLLAHPPYSLLFVPCSLRVPLSGHAWRCSGATSTSMPRCGEGAWLARSLCMRGAAHA